MDGGKVVLQDATHDGGTKGGKNQVGNFAIAKFPITNTQYENFLRHSNGFSNTQWWEFSPEATQWRKDHKKPKPTAFTGPDLPRTRVSWFDSMAFCGWLSAELMNTLHDDKSPDTHDVFTWIIRLPTEQEWQRAAIGDTGGVILGAMLWMRRVETMAIMLANLVPLISILQEKACMESWI